MGLGNIGLPGLILIAIVVLVLFGRGKISSLMGEVGKGITAFKKGVDEGKNAIEDETANARDVTPPDHGDVTPNDPEMTSKTDDKHKV